MANNVITTVSLNDLYDDTVKLSLTEFNDFCSLKMVIDNRNGGFTEVNLYFNSREEVADFMVALQDTFYIGKEVTVRKRESK